MLGKVGYGQGRRSPGEEEDPGGRKSAPVGLGCCKKREDCSSRKWILEENGEQLNRMFHRGEVRGAE